MKRIVSLLFFFAFPILISGQDAPAWVKSFPYSPRYYTGIGSSSRGDRSHDYERALAQARANLAAEISTSISSETVIETEDRGDGNLRESYYEKLNQSVEQNLKEVEIVDTWYSEKQGYWVYIRLDKNRWNEIRAEETASLLDRVRQILDGDYFSPSQTTAGKFNLLASASQLLNESPYGLVVSGSLGGKYSGNISDFIISEIYRLGSVIRIETGTSKTMTSLNAGAELFITCHSEENYTGKIPLKIENPQYAVQFRQTDINGNVRMALHNEMLNPGRNRLEVSIDFSRLGFPVDSIYERSFIPVISLIEISVSASRIFLDVQSNRVQSSSVDSSIRALFNGSDDKFEFTEVPDGADYTLIYALDYSEYPRVLENAPLMVGLRGHLSLKKENRVLYEYETDLFKDGGLTYDQAAERVFRKMIGGLSDSAPFITDIENSINQ